jgi:predicted enzyme related to lactoylglutathione lyase
MKAYYVEIVSKRVEEQCKVLEQVHGISFGPEVEDLGLAKVAETASGNLIGVRAPLAEHEQPITRVYFAVEDIIKAVEAAEAAGAMIAYPPTKQGDTGIWAIYILDEIQYGLWQQQ